MRRTGECALLQAVVPGLRLRKEAQDFVQQPVSLVCREKKLSVG